MLTWLQNLLNLNSLSYRRKLLPYNTISTSVCLAGESCWNVGMFKTVILRYDSSYACLHTLQADWWWIILVVTSFKIPRQTNTSFKVTRHTIKTHMLSRPTLLDLNDKPNTIHGRMFDSLHDQQDCLSLTRSQVRGNLQEHPILDSKAYEDIF